MKKLVRSSKDKKIAGVLGGLGEYLSVDPTILRLLAVFMGIATGFIRGVITYIIGWIIIPEETAAKKT